MGSGQREVEQLVADLFVISERYFKLKGDLVSKCFLITCESIYTKIILTAFK